LHNSVRQRTDSPACAEGTNRDALLRSQPTKYGAIEEPVCADLQHSERMVDRIIVIDRGAITSVE
jgi:hypothetical protein